MDDPEGCLIDELKRLKESSKEAVENIDSFSPFKEYMHEKRKVQFELLELLKKAEVINKSQLILVCGGTGDGKSHLISYLNLKEPDLMNKFDEHNDATESFEPLKTSIDTLNDVLDRFSDEKLNSSTNKKLILAINLGALNNFIDSKYGNKFSELKQYVIDKKILDSDSENNSFDEDSHFQFINFSDYHMYTLTEGGAKSDFIFNLLNKIIKDDNNNIFYQSYKNNCIKCECGNKCPIKANYEFLMDKEAQKKVIDILIEAMIKEKSIISTRTLLNFFYDIIVDSSINNIKVSEMKKLILQKDFINYINLLTPSILYNHKDISDVLLAIKSIDPINLRTEKLDEWIVKLNTTNDISQVILDNIDFSNYKYIEDVLKDKQKINDYINSKKNKSYKKDLIMFFIRLYKFKAKTTDIDLNDEIYLKYIKNLYYWNKGTKNKLIDLYSDILEAVYKWNGECEKENINLFIGRNQLNYRICEKLSVVPCLDNIKEKQQSELYKFIPNLIIGYKKQNTDEKSFISIDYSLYKLLLKIKDGYRPNNKDKYNYINFVEFVDKLIQMGEQDRELYFEDNKDYHKKYKLVYKKEFNQYSFMEM